MALSKFQSFVAILVLLVPIAAKGDIDIPPSLSPIFDIPPSLSPIFDDLCKEVACGKGSCQIAPGSPFNFKCECDDGWKRTPHDDDDNLQFLPCIIPNCSVDYSCMPAPPPLPALVLPPLNLSFFDPCNWIYCGEGTCTTNTTHTRTHTCQCNAGYSNLLNISALPCYRDCATGSDSCKKLGIKVASSTSNPSTTESASDTNQAISFSLGKFNLMAVLLAAATVISLK